MKEKDNIFGSLLFIAQRWTINGDSILKDKTGITMKQWMLLVLLLNLFNGENPTITETAKAFGTSRQNLKQIIDSLQKKEILITRPDKNDSRIQRIVLTGKHEVLFEGKENEKWQKDYMDSLFKGITPDEIILLNKIINKLSNNL